MSLSPALPRGSWYTEAAKEIQAYRDELAAEEAKTWSKRREPILEKLKEQLDLIDDRRDLEDKPFAEWIWGKWPPKTPGSETFPEGESIKKVYLKVIQRYHTDKNGSFGEEWMVMSEEISKSLNSRYNVMKGL